MHLPRGQHVVTPTTLDENNSDKCVGLSHNISAKRRKLTYDCAKKVHSTPSTEPEVQCATANGLWSTLVNNCKTKVVTDLLKKSKTVCKTVVPQIVAKSVAKFEKSSKNFLRSVSVLYKGGILSKRKYCNIRSSEIFDYDIPAKKRKRTEFEEGCRLPALVPYKELMKFIEVQDIGKLNSIPQATAECEVEKENEEVDGNLLPVVPGYYIDLKERLLQMADLYLHIDSHIPNFLTWFGKQKAHFLVAVGADGAPFGKANEACAWLVSFLNVSERVASPDDNFLICGANCAEDHPAMVEYGKQLRSEMATIASQTFSVRDQQVKFEFKLVPSDMKWLAKFSGELSNAARYPCSFANVQLSELQERGQSLSNNPQSKWRPWEYKFREEVAKKVTQFKEKQGRPINAAQEQTLRTKVCNHIASLKSRQEFEPILGPVIQNAKCDSLHVGNNCWGHWHKLLFTHVLAKAKIPTSTKSVFQLAEDNSLRKHLKALRFKLKCKKMYNKILRWFKEKRKSSASEFRFTGEETKKFCDGFMYLIQAQIEEGNIEQAKSFFVLSLGRMGLHLRNSLSLASRVSNISSSDLPNLEQDCRQYFNLTSLFHSANLSVWAMGYCVPFHTKQLFEDLGVGLGINSMQGRESKHQQLASFASFSLVKHRWSKVFRHEHMSNIWIRQQNPFHDTYKKCKDTYVPKRCSTAGYCSCGMPLSTASACMYCSCEISKEIIACGSAGKLTVKMKKILAEAQK